jgi:hypothetical protein
MSKKMQLWLPGTTSKAVTTALSGVNTATVKANLIEIQEAIGLVVTIVKDLHGGLNEICECILKDLKDFEKNSIKKHWDIKQFLSQIDELVVYSSKFAHSVKSLFICCDETKLVNIQSRLYDGDTAPLKSFLCQIQESISSYEGCYENYKKFFVELNDYILSAGMICEELSGNAKNIKVVTQATGGTLATGLIGAAAVGAVSTVVATGTAITIIGGLCSFGIGIPIGVAVTSGAAAATATAAGTATAAVTAYIACKFSNMSTKLKDISEKLQVVHGHAGNLHEKLTDMKTSTDCTIAHVDSVKFSLSVTEVHGITMVCEELQNLIQDRKVFWDCIERECREIELIQKKMRESRKSI